jgi:hypothetical protein
MALFAQPMYKQAEEGDAVDKLIGSRLIQMLLDAELLKM